MSDTEQDGPYWKCKGCGELFEDGEYEKQMEHAEEEHGAFDAVSFKAVPSWKVRERDTESQP